MEDQNPKNQEGSTAPEEGKTVDNPTITEPTQDDPAQELREAIQFGLRSGLSEDDMKDEIAALKELEGAAAPKPQSKPNASTDDKGDDQGDSDDDDDSEDDPFGLLPKAGKKKASAKEPKDWEEFKVVAKTFGTDDPAKLYKSVGQWRKQAQKASEVEQQLTVLNDGLASLPVPVKAAIEASLSGGDYKKAFNDNATDIDFLSTFEENKPEKVARSFFQGKFSKLDQQLESGKIEQEDYDERKQELIELAKDKFEAKAKSVALERDRIIKKAEDDAKAASESLQVSVSKLTEKFPSMSKKAVSQVEEVLKDPNKILSLFIDKSGKFTPQAASLLSYAMNGEKLVQAAMEAAEKKGKNAGVEEVVERGRQYVDRKTSNNDQGLDAKSQELLKRLDSTSGAYDPSEVYRSK